jgi:antitoxin ParD1/3/4
MKAYKIYLTIRDPKHVVLPDVPFHSGQRVEVVLLATEDDQDTRVNELKTLFKTTQKLPQAKSITEQEIAAEVEAYRRGQ